MKKNSQARRSFSSVLYTHLMYYFPKSRHVIQLGMLYHYCTPWQEKNKKKYNNKNRDVNKNEGASVASQRREPVKQE